MRKGSLLWIPAVAAATLLSCAQDQGPFLHDNPLDPDGSNWYPPSVTAMRDTSVSINDSITITAAASDNGTIAK
jgi:hypothetical protein